jgi:hypothetical protein
MALHFDDVRYRKRQLVENMFSVMKRKFSGDLKARISPIQKKEISGKMIVCNIHRFLQFLVFEVFYRVEFYSIPGGLNNFHKQCEHLSGLWKDQEYEIEKNEGKNPRFLLTILISF